MIDDALFEILVCPQDRTPLRLADDELLDRLNRAVAESERQILTLDGRAVEEPFAAGLVREDGRVFYPIVDGVPVLLADEAVALEQIHG